MILVNCAKAKDLLPGFVRDDLADEEHRWTAEHIAVCVDCQQEAELLRRIHNNVVRVPVGLASDIKAALARKQKLPRWSMRWLVAAATIALALGIGVVWDRVRALPEVGPLGREPFAVVWPSDDADVAGAPTLESLTDDDLTVLFEELGG